MTKVKGHDTAKEGMTSEEVYNVLGNQAVDAVAGASMDRLPQPSQAEVEERHKRIPSKVSEIRA